MRPFPKSLSMQLLRARELLMQRFRPHLYAHGLTEQQWRVVRALWEVDEMSNQQLCDRCVLHPASMSRILPKLEAEGLIRRHPIKEDRRNLSVTLTPKGRKLVTKLMPGNDEIFAATVEEIGEDVIDEAYDALEALNAGLSRGLDRPIMTATPEARRNARS
jgi:homoprotocatechuate degradation regulator HpaR